MLHEFELGKLLTIYILISVYFSIIFGHFIMGKKTTVQLNQDYLLCWLPFIR